MKKKADKMQLFLTQWKIWTISLLVGMSLIGCNSHSKSNEPTLFSGNQKIESSVQIAGIEIEDVDGTRVLADDPETNHGRVILDNGSNNGAKAGEIATVTETLKNGKTEVAIIYSNSQGQILRKVTYIRNSNAQGKEFVYYNGYMHRVKQEITFQSPHKAANYPLITTGDVTWKKVFHPPYDPENQKIKYHITFNEGRRVNMIEYKNEYEDVNGIQTKLRLVHYNETDTTSANNPICDVLEYVVNSDYPNRVYPHYFYHHSGVPMFYIAHIANVGWKAFRADNHEFSSILNNKVHVQTRSPKAELDHEFYNYRVEQIRGAIKSKSYGKRDTSTPPSTSSRIRDFFNGLGT